MCNSMSHLYTWEADCLLPFFSSPNVNKEIRVFFVFSDSFYTLHFFNFMTIEV